MTERRTDRDSALRDFLRGYLHEDWKAEHGTAAKAAQQFCEESDLTQVTELRTQWEDFVRSAKGENIQEVARRLHQLGSAWQPSNVSELDEISRVLQRCTST